MTTTYHELFKSQSGTDATDNRSTAQRYWAVMGSSDLDTARNAILAAAQADFDGLKFDSLEHEYVGDKVWIFTANYTDPERQEQKEQLAVDEYRISFDTTGAQTRMMVSYQTNTYPRNQQTIPPDFDNAIDVDQNGRPRGVDVIIPSLKFDITYRQAKAVITNAYIRTLADLTGKVNDAAFYGFNAGEVLFLGAAGSQSTKSDPEITYKFVASPNATFSVAGISNVTKQGHQYLWVWYETDEDVNAHTLRPNAHTVFVETVYRNADFSQLGIGS